MGCFVCSSLDARSKKLDHLSCQSRGGTPFGALHGWVWVVYNGTGANDGCLPLLMKFLVCASPLRQKGAPHERLPDHHPPSSKPLFSFFFEREREGGWDTPNRWVLFPISLKLTSLPKVWLLLVLAFWDRECEIYVTKMIHNFLYFMVSFCPYITKHNAMKYAM